MNQNSILKAWPIGLAMAAALFTTSCQKEAIVEQNGLPPVMQGALTQNHFIKNAADADEEAFNEALYNIGFAARDLLKSKKVAERVVEAASLTTHHEVDLLDFLTNEGLMDEYKAALGPQVGDYSADFSVEEYISTHLVYDIEYQAKILVANFDALDLNEDPWIGCGLQIDEDDYPNKPDEFLLWTQSDDGWELTSANNETIVESTHPMFGITNGVELPDDILVAPAPSSERRPNGSNFPIWRNTTTSLVFHYEASGASEFQIAVLDWSEPNLFDPGWVSEVSFSRTEINNIVVKTVNVDVFADPSNVSGTNLSDIGTYEFDGGFTSAKQHLQCRTAANVVKTMGTKRKFDNEWYHFDPYNGTTNPQGYNWRGLHPNHLSARVQNDTKGALTLVRRNSN